MHKFGIFMAVFSMFLPVWVLADMNPCEIAEITASDAGGDDLFGCSVSINGDYAIVGAYREDIPDFESGSAYIFRRDGMIWAEEAKLTASDAIGGDYFGYSVSINGDYTLIGAHNNDDAGSNSGSAYIFRRDGSTWTEEAKLTASDGTAYDEFGYSVSIHGDYAIIGAWYDDDEGSESGSAYIFRRDGSTWIQEAKLTAGDGATGDNFGYSVSISGDYAIIGAWYDDDEGSNSGSAYIFRRNGTTWIEEAKLTAGDGAAGDYFGESVSISGDYAIIGAYQDDHTGNNSGSAYIFRRNGSTWSQEAKLTASDGARSDEFGDSVCISGDSAIVGVHFDDDGGPYSGSAYIFRRNGSTWTEEAKLTASDASEMDFFGNSVSISGDYALIGAWGDNDMAEWAGSAYVYGLSGVACGTLILAGPGPEIANPPLVRVFPPEQDADYVYEVKAYGPSDYGVNVTCGVMTGDGFDKIITGPGPGPIYGPHVRGFEVDGTPLQGLSFIAYGTRKWGANVACGDIDDDGFDEIITGPGPGAVFGPHVRAFDYDGTPSVTPVPGVSYFAYGTRKWGVNVAAGDIDGDGFDEIITGPGPGAVFGPHVRGWNVDDSPATALPEASFFAYGTRKFGAVVTLGELDIDGFDEIITAPGPGVFFSAHIRGWDYDDTSITPVSGCNFFAWPSTDARYGARIYCGADLNQDSRDELVVGCGPDPSVASHIKVFLYNGAQVSEWFSLQAFPSEWTHGANVAAGRFSPP